MNPHLGGDESESVLPCEVDPDTWFAEGNSIEARLDVEYATSVCERCPVLRACGELAAKIRPSHGVWAGRNWSKPPSQQPRGDRLTRQQLSGTTGGNRRSS